ncbi:MAG: cob(I)yrinic acid a,c-diamide adenosyltransferase [Elusimicrobia bacterium]|nr:cob(I)yrinic acid a,c-diamide adenosyltransferase [Elusimicrobiota bacterium]
MTKIYTKTGDRGETGLWGGRRVAKNHPRVRAYGEIDELNSALGAALASIPATRNFALLRAALTRIQKELFQVGALLATPPDETHRLPEAFREGPTQTAVRRLESEIDALTADIKPMRHFILPGGSLPGALLHVSRTVCRRAEREIASLHEREAVPDSLLVYVNRLSDHLFTAARWTNARLRRAETPWSGLASDNS